jgi:hypothetical protein
MTSEGRRHKRDIFLSGILVLVGTGAFLSPIGFDLSALARGAPLAGIVLLTPLALLSAYSYLTFRLSRFLSQPVWQPATFCALYE